MRATTFSANNADVYSHVRVKTEYTIHSFLDQGLTYAKYFQVSFPTSLLPPVTTLPVKSGIPSTVKRIPEDDKGGEKRAGHDYGENGPTYAGSEGIGDLRISGSPGRPPVQRKSKFRKM